MSDFILSIAICGAVAIACRIVDAVENIKIAKYTTDFEIEFEEDEDASTNTRESFYTNGQ